MSQFYLNSMVSTNYLKELNYSNHLYFTKNYHYKNLFIPLSMLDFYFINFINLTIQYSSCSIIINFYCHLYNFILYNLNFWAY